MSNIIKYMTYTIQMFGDSMFFFKRLFLFSKDEFSRFIQKWQYTHS